MRLSCFIRPAINIAVTMMLGVSLAACNPASGEQKPEPMVRPVLVSPVHFAAETEPRTFVAAIRPRIEADQAFRVSGKVARRLVDTGAKVKAGEPIAKLDEADLKLQREQAEAELAASKRGLDQAVADEERSATLRKQGWTAQAVYDRARTALEEARSRNIRAQRASELTRNAFDYATLKADADGLVTATMIEPGQVVAAGQTAIRIARQSEKEAVVSLPETFAARAKEGKASLSLWAVPGRNFRAVLRELSPSADPVSRTFLARFSLPDADDAVSLGMSATLTITGGDARVARVPLSAIFNQGKGPSLWVVDDKGALTLTRVDVVRYEARDALVTSGVNEGANIVVLGVQKLDPGMRVRIVTDLTF